jgi:hypothetical protein
MNERFLSRNEAAARLAELGLAVAPATLASAVTRGNGPPCYRFGRRSVYPERALVEWAESRLRPAGRRTAAAAE